MNPTVAPAGYSLSKGSSGSSGADFTPLSCPARTENTIPELSPGMLCPENAPCWSKPAASLKKTRKNSLVAKVEVNEVGINRRFVVTNRADLSPRPLYDSQRKTTSSQ